MLSNSVAEWFCPMAEFGCVFSAFPFDIFRWPNGAIRWPKIYETKAKKKQFKIGH